MEPLPHCDLAALLDALPACGSTALECALAEVTRRPIRYHIGSGQADELALRAGLKPLMRELLSAGDIERAMARYAHAGLQTAVAPRRYAPTRDGWDHCDHEPSSLDPGARRALFVGRDRGRIEAAVACDLANTAEADRELGRLLGYPRCCVEAFVECSAPRKNPDVQRAASGRTRGRAMPRLNVADLGIFHFVSWYPCAFDCAWSARYADAVADLVARIDEGFVARIDRALACHRLVLADDAQLSLAGERRGGTIRLRAAWPTARDRHPRAQLAPLPAQIVARALVAVQKAHEVEVDGSSLRLDGCACNLPAPPLLLPFGDG